MTVTPANVHVAITGGISKAPIGTAAPTSATATLNMAFVDSGGISEEGVTLSLPGGGDSTPIKVWQNGATVRTIRTASEDLPSISFTFLETNKTAVETYFGVTVTQSGADGTFDYTVGLRQPAAYVLDVEDGDENHRFYFPRGVVSEVGEIVYANGEPIGYNVTIEAELDPTAGYNFRSWITSLGLS